MIDVININTTNNKHLLKTDHFRAIQKPDLNRTNTLFEFGLAPLFLFTAINVGKWNIENIWQAEK